MLGGVNMREMHIYIKNILKQNVIRERTSWNFSFRV